MKPNYIIVINCHDPERAEVLKDEEGMSLLFHYAEAVEKQSELNTEIKSFARVVAI
jgi:hypothetical protein